MKESPILFSASMIRAILEDRKTQTRRIIKPQPMHGLFPWFCNGEWGLYLDRPNAGPYQHIGKCPHGVPGDRLWVKETFAAWRRTSVENPLEWDTITGNLTKYVAEYGRQGIQIAYRADGDDEGWRPSIFMPRWASRITVENENIRVQRLQDISDEDAIAEGLRIHENPKCSIGVGRYMYTGFLGNHSLWEFDPKTAYMKLWDSINAKRGFGWDKNPWVWAITFKRVKA